MTNGREPLHCAGRIQSAPSHVDLDVIAGALLIGLGVVAIVSAHVFTPRRYAFVAIAITEKIVCVGLLIAIFGALGRGINWMQSPNR